MSNRIAVRALIIHDGKLLCVRQKPYDITTKANVGSNSWWCLPGGKAEPNEPLTDALQREIIEETDVSPKLGELLYIHQYRSGDTENLEFFFYVTNNLDFQSINLAETTHGESEIAEIRFVDPKTTDILPKFLTTEDIFGQAASVCPVKIFSYL